MSQTEVKAVIETILENNKVGTMATVKNNKPHSRYMTFSRNGFNLYTATSKDTHKAEEIEQNPYTHILLGYEGEGFGDDYVEYEGKAKVTNSDELKEELWSPYMENWFDGVDDPTYMVLEIAPEQIHLLNKKGVEPKTLEL